MYKKLLFPLAGVAVFIIFVGLLYQGKIKFLSPQSSATPKASINLSGTTLHVDISDTNEERAKGLGGVLNLKEDEGMLFVFDEKDVNPGFWMKEMLIPIDIIWINDGKIVKIDKNVAKPDSDTPDSQLKVYYPSTPIDYVLEVNAGFSDSHNLKIGDPAEGNPIKN